MPVYKDMYSRSAAFQQFETLKRNREKRAKQKLFFLEGVHPVEQAVAAGYAFYAIGCDAEARLSGWAEDMIRRARPEIVYRMAHALREELSDRDNPCELVCLVRMRPELKAIDAPDALYTVFDRATTPGNLGTVIRSADAFGSRCVITTGHSADFYDPQCVRASIGTLFHIDHAALESCDAAMAFFDSLPVRPKIRHQRPRHGPDRRGGHDRSGGPGRRQRDLWAVQGLEGALRRAGEDPHLRRGLVPERRLRRDRLPL